MSTMMTCPRAGTIDDVEPDDDFHQLVRHLAAAGDRSAAAGGRRARRTLAEMAPGYERQPVLTLHRPQMADRCPLCDRTPCADLCPYRTTTYAPTPAAHDAGAAR
ncbi:hypothetical protein [Streptomyces sp. NPDC014894]|uniref:hypothetical protein n=1 Tax=Streptomyces sp. NPDC014894 TaxID=3364931 RepID=UPI0037005ED3